jgi:hypothetical protein
VMWPAPVAFVIGDPCQRPKLATGESTFFASEIPASL